MSLNRFHEALYARALRLLDGHELGAATRAIVAPLIPESEGDAQTAMLLMRAGKEPTAEQAAALAMVIRILRPILPILNNCLPPLPQDAKHALISDAQRARWGAFREYVHPVMPSIGRIETSKGQHVGTGFIVGKELMATNRHVLEALTAGTCMVSRINPPRATFDTGSVERDIVLIHSVHSVHGKLDLVILKVDATDRAPVVFSEEELEEGTSVVVVGFPGMDTQNPYFLERILKDIQGYKCASLGEVLERDIQTTIFHDCSTSQGNSGSPIFSLRTGRVVAIHKSGRFMYRNEAVPQSQLAKLINRD